MKQSVLSNIFLTIISTMVAGVLGIAGIEFSIWHYSESDKTWHDPNTNFDAYLGWAPVKNSYSDAYGGASSNSLGFRSAELNPNLKHIAWMGDSFAWGYGVNNKNTAAHLVDQSVHRKGYQVQNLGVSGYGLGQYYLYLQKHLDQLNNLKWVVVSIYTGNDLLNTGSNSSYGKRKPLFLLKNSMLVLQNEEPIKKYCLRNLLSKSYVIRKLGKDNPIVKMLEKATGDITLSKAETRLVAEKLLEKIHNLGSKSGVKVTFVIIPAKQDHMGPKSEDFTWFLNLLDEKKFEYINMYNIIQDSGHPLDDLYCCYNHYSEIGNRMYAEAVMNYWSENFR